MKEFFNRYNPIIYVFFAILFFLPFGGFPVVYCIIAIIVDFLVAKKWKQLNGFFDLNNLGFWMVSLYVYILISMLWTQNVKAGKFELEQKLSFLIIPILVYSNQAIIKRNFKNICNVFILSNCIASIFMITRGFMLLQSNADCIHDHSGYLPFYSDFSSFLHVAYASFYIAVSLLLCINFIFETSDEVYKYIYGLAFLILLIAFYYLSSKGVFAAFAFMILVNFIYIFWQSKNKWRIGIFAILIIILSIIGFRNNPRIYSVKKMITEVIDTRKADPNASSDISNGQRIYVIKSGLKVIRNNFLFGVGAGDVIDEMESQYVKSNYKVLAQKKLNCHNQFIEFFVELGVFGFIMFMTILIISMLIAIKNRNIILISFIVGFVVVANTESFLNHQAGIVFFTLFICILNVAILKNNPTNEG